VDTSTSTTCGVCELHAEATFRVEGMDCGEEVTLLERRLRPLVGLEAMSADLLNQRLHVTFDAARLSTTAMVEAIGGTGMRMWLEHEQPTSYGTTVEWRWHLVRIAAAGMGVGLLLQGLVALGWVGAKAGEIADVLFLAAAAIGAVYPARRALVSIRSRSIDINVLMVVAVSGAVALGEWSEAASVVLLFAIAQWLEARTMERARQAIRALMDLTPPEALVRRDGADVRVGVDQVAVGDTIVVRPGGKVPLDGEILSGRTDVNESSITGESLPVDKAPGDEVFAGTINGRGAIDVRVTRLRDDTRLARIVHLVEEAQSKRAPVQTLVDRFARVYTPIVILVALAMVLGPWVAGGDMDVWIYRALVLLVVACPCALVISTPVSVVAALAGAARHGVLVKGGAQLERLAAVKVVAFDKTGTLTRGEPAVAGVVAMPGLSPAQVIETAARVEARSEHPIARAVAAAASSAVAAATDVTVLPGLGAEGVVDGQRILVGNARLMTGRGIDPAVAGLDTGGIERPGRSIVFVAVEGRAIGAIAVADRIRDTAREAIESLRGQQVTRLVMLTGDHPAAAAPLADELGLDEVHAGLLPEQKHELVQALRTRHGAVLMVGDGVNDAPALAVADVGAAMGAAGSDAALETADVALMSDELLKLPYALRLARAALGNIRTNIAIALVLKFLVLGLAVAGIATLWLAILADTGASVIVVGNAVRLLRAR